MNWNRLSLVAAPSTAPLSLEAAKRHLRLEVDDTAQDDDVDDAIAAAVAVIDGPRGIGFAMVEQTWQLSLDRFERVISIPLGPTTEIVSMTYVDSAGATIAMVEDTDFVADLDQDPAVICAPWGQSFPVARCQPGAIKIVFKAGVPVEEVPADLIAALKLLVGHLFENREAVAVLAAGSAVTLPLGVAPILERYAASGIT